MKKAVSKEAVIEEEKNKSLRQERTDTATDRRARSRDPKS